MQTTKIVDVRLRTDRMKNKDRIYARWFEDLLKERFNLEDVLTVLRACYPGRLTVIREIHTIEREITNE